ncbi:MAG: hypothetical protein LH470_10935 [Lysobacter sp.]|nr:hypothetical protein [Lysobacter sp.]
MTGDSVLTAEVSNSKVAAIFTNEATAHEVAARLRSTLQLSDAQVQVITPADRRPGHKLEPESQGIFRTIIRAHVRLGLLGAVAGAAAFGVLWWMELPLIVNSAVMAAAVMVAFGAVAGLMLGGLVSLRPDHDLYINKVYDALGEGRSAVVVHAFSREQSAQAKDLLKGASGEVVSTL